MITPERLKEMREVAGAATPGPWTFQPLIGGSGSKFITADNGKTIAVDCVYTRDGVYVARFDPPTVLEILNELERYREAQERINEDFLLEVITKWKFNWMDVKNTDKADRDNYRRRAFGVDANMQYSLAGMLLKALRGEG